MCHEATRPHQFQSTTTALVANRRTSHTSSALSSRTQQLDECRPTLLQSAATASSRSPLRAANRGDYVVPRTNRGFADQAFSTAARRAWNQLPTYLTRSSAVAERPRDASCLSVVSFNIQRCFFITSYCGFRFTSA